MSLLDLLEEWVEPTSDWAPIYYRFTLADLVRDRLCRDCGTKVKWANCSGGTQEGSYQLCDPCANLEGCLTRQHTRGDDWHLSRWAVDYHRADEHDELIHARERRRAAYRARQARETEVPSHV